MLQLLHIRLSNILADRKGISAMEYAILAGVLVGVIAAAVTGLGNDISGLFNNVGNKLNSIAT